MLDARSVRLDEDEGDNDWVAFFGIALHCIALRVGFGLFMCD